MLLTLWNACRQPCREWGVILLFQPRVPFEPVLRRSLVDDLDHLVEELIAEDMAGYAVVADALWSMLARMPAAELLVHAAAASVV